MLSTETSDKMRTCICSVQLSSFKLMGFRWNSNWVKCIQALDKIETWEPLCVQLIWVLKTFDKTNNQKHASVRSNKLPLNFKWAKSIRGLNWNPLPRINKGPKVWGYDFRLIFFLSARMRLKKKWMRKGLVHWMGHGKPISSSTSSLKQCSFLSWVYASVGTKMNGKLFGLKRL